MTSRIGIGVLAVCATTMSARPAAATAVPRTGSTISASELCTACLAVCTAPFNQGDDVLDESTDLYMSAATRVVATAAAIGLADALRSVHRDYAGGYFGPAYLAGAASIESLARKRAESDHATSAEIRALKRVRAALFADTVVGLRAIAAVARSEAFLATYRAREAVLGGVLASLSSPQPMRAAERQAVCQVLAHVP